jgi:hypothetical protein
MTRRTFLPLFGSAALASRAAAQTGAPEVWPSRPPRGCPFPQSGEITGIGFMGQWRTYTHADTWYPSWASDGNLYSPWTDGTVNGVRSTSGGPKATTGQAKIVGADPMELDVICLGLHSASPEPYGGRYPCGSLVYEGVWYYGTYCLDLKNPHLNWDVLGPFVGFRMSRDFGKAWTDTELTPSNSLFGESGKNGAKVKIGSPHFVDFGKNMQYSPDGKAYLTGHGAVRPDAQLSWISGDQVYLIRVEPSPANINDRSKYEFFAGHDDQGRPRWTRDFARIQPLVEWNDRAGCVTMTYNAPLKKYLMCITDGFPTIFRMNTYVLESDQITGPWKLVTFMQSFGEQGYFVNFPSKFISADGRTAWLSYSTNFTNHGRYATNWAVNPPGGSYAFSLQQVRFMRG